MKRPNLGLGALVGILLTAPITGLLYLADQLAGFSFVPFELFDWITPLIPGPIITFGIDAMIDTLRFFGGPEATTNAKTAEQIMAVGMFLVGGIITGVIYTAVLNWRKMEPTTVDGIVMGALFGLPMIAISLAVGDPAVNLYLNIVWLAVMFLGWGVAFAYTYRRLSTAAAPAAAAPDEEARAVEKIDRRQFLIRLGASTATITVVSGGVAAALAAVERRREAAALEDTMAHQFTETGNDFFPNANDPVTPAPGTRPEYTPLKDHYKVFLRTEPSIIEEADWILPITGMVDNPQMLTLDDIRNNYPAMDQFVTLSCISGRIGTSLISTTQWTGVSAQALLADLGIQEGAEYLDIISEDGFHETVPLELINSDERIMFCYDWDGEPLPKDHGFPLRIWIPDRYGMKQPKWITGIEVTDQYREGYWVQRNWSETAQVKTTSVIDTVAVNAVHEDSGQRFVPVGGIAWAGDRQISRVEVRVDGGEWQEAQLRSPLSETTWVIWRYEWPFQEGDHTFEVRCFEGDGTMQILEESSARPDGATGIHSEEATLETA